MRLPTRCRWLAGKNLGAWSIRKVLSTWNRGSLLTAAPHPGVTRTLREEESLWVQNGKETHNDAQLCLECLSLPSRQPKPSSTFRTQQKHGLFHEAFPDLPVKSSLSLTPLSTLTPQASSPSPLYGTNIPGLGALPGGARSGSSSHKEIP